MVGLAPPRVHDRSVGWGSGRVARSLSRRSAAAASARILRAVREHPRDKAKTDFERRRTPTRRPSPGSSARAPLDSVQGVLQLQRSIGNQAVYRLVAGGVLQTKLKVGPAGDTYEREADAVAAEVMRNLESSVTPAEDEVESPVRRSALEGVVGPEGGALGADTEAGIERHRGGGSPLPAPLRRSMEGSFGADFGGVRVHTRPGGRRAQSLLPVAGVHRGRRHLLRPGPVSTTRPGGPGAACARPHPHRPAGCGPPGPRRLLLTPSSATRRPNSSL